MVSGCGQRREDSEMSQRTIKKQLANKTQREDVGTLKKFKAWWGKYWRKVRWSDYKILAIITPRDRKGKIKVL